MVAAIQMNGIYHHESSSPYLCSMHNAIKMWHFKKPKNSVEFLSSSLLDSSYYFRLSDKMISSSRNDCARMKKKQRTRKFSVVNELGGQYEETFNDIKLQTLNCFTNKAVRTVLHQLQEMNPPEYMWLYNFVATNDPRDGKRFLRNLGKEKQDLAERVMITRLNLYAKWIKICDHAEIYKEISDQNLELMRERLLETIVWPSDDTNAGKSE